MLFPETHTHGLLTEVTECRLIPDDGESSHPPPPRQASSPPPACLRHAHTSPVCQHRHVTARAVVALQHAVPDSATHLHRGEDRTDDGGGGVRSDDSACHLSDTTNLATHWRDANNLRRLLTHGEVRGRGEGGTSIGPRDG